MMPDTAAKEGGGRGEDRACGKAIRLLRKPEEDSGLHLGEQASDLDSMTKDI